jgi:hypothetical protein
LACITNNGPKFGFAVDWDVCAGAHCSNDVMDGDETGADCGGSCGTCSTCVGTAGSKTFCVGCLCASGQGDCDSTSECGSGLTCGVNNGPKFGLGAAYDVCVPPHCTNRVLDAASGETAVDLGGPCAASCGNAVLNTGEACDEATNDGLLCNADCTVGPEVARIHEHCDPGSAVISSLRGSQCITIQGGASYLTFVSGAVAVTMYSNGDCTGMSTTRTSPVNFCGGTFNEGGGLNDQVRSAKVSRL